MNANGSGILPDTPLMGQLNSVYAGEGWVCAVGGSGRAARFDGTAWQSIAAPTGSRFDGVWGVGQDDIFAVGDSGMVARFDGASWTITSVGQWTSLHAVWGSASDDVFAVGAKTTLNQNNNYEYSAAAYHFDGNEWVEMDGMVGQSLSDVWGSSGDDVYAVGSTGLHYNGSNWSPVIPWNPFNALRAVWGSSPANVYAVGTTWEQVGQVGLAMHYDGAHWTRVRMGTGWLFDITGTDDTHIYACQEYAKNQLVLYDGATWQDVSFYTLPRFTSVWMDSEDVFAVGREGQILRRAGFFWRPMESGTTRNLRGVWGDEEGGAFAVGEAGTILRYDGSTWAPMASNTPAALRDVWGATAQDAFAVGDKGTILHYANDVWSPMTSDISVNLNSVWGLSPQDAYAVGDSGVVARYNQGKWEVIETGTNKNLLAVWVDSASRVVFAGGEDGMFLSSAGSGWKSIPVAPYGDLRGIWGFSASDVYVTTDASIQHFDGTAAKSAYVFQSGPLSGIHGFGPTMALAVAEDGSVFQYHP